MESRQNTPAPSAIPGHPTGYLSNAGVERYLLESESTTGFVAWKMADGTILVSQSMQVSIRSSPSLSFWSCAGYQDTTPAGRIILFDCHGNSLTHLDVRALTGLEYLDCSYNRLNELALDGLTELQSLDADNNLLASLNVHHIKLLRVLYCASNRLTTLDLSGLDLLQILDCFNNPLASLKLDGCTSLQDFESPQHLGTDRLRTRD